MARQSGAPQRLVRYERPPTPRMGIGNLARVHFSLDHSDRLFGLVATHRMSISPAFWKTLGRTIGLKTDTPVDTEVLGRWVSILLDSASQTRLNNMHSTVLLWLTERCAEQGLADSVLEISSLGWKRAWATTPVASSTASSSTSLGPRSSSQAWWLASISISMPSWGMRRRRNRCCRERRLQGLPSSAGISPLKRF